jgi:sRNA-binding protein
MQPPEQQNETSTQTAAMKPGAVTEPDYAVTPQPIRELAGRDDFPQCTLGVYVDIQGFAGVVVEIVRDSIKVRPSDGVTQRFNANRLRTLYAPPVHLEPAAMTVESRREKSSPDSEVTVPKAEAPARFCIENPDFAAPLQPISDYASQPDFPRCVYGKHVDILGCTGVVVEIVKGSLKVQTLAGITRSYNADVLKKLHGKSDPK